MALITYVTSRADVDRMHPAVAREEHRALAIGLQQEEAGPGEEALCATPLCIELDTRRGTQISARVHHDRHRAVELEHLDVALRCGREVERLTGRARGERV